MYSDNNYNEDDIIGANDNNWIDEDKFFSDLCGVLKMYVPYSAKSNEHPFRKLDEYHIADV